MSHISFTVSQLSLSVLLPIFKLSHEEVLAHHAGSLSFGTIILPLAIVIVSIHIVVFSLSMLLIELELSFVDISIIVLHFSIAVVEAVLEISRVGTII